MVKRSVTALYFNRRMLVLLGLGFSSGLPLLLTASTLQAWMRNEGIELSTIGLFALVTLPYSLKFLWAPVMDRVTWPLPGLGRRRGWLILTQLALAASIRLMAEFGPAAGLPSLILLVTAALLVGFFSASQDVVADAYRTDVLDEPERGAGAAVFVTGYRVGMIVGGAVALVLSRHASWPDIYMLMAAGMTVGVAATLLAAEPRNGDAPRTMRDAVVEPLREFVTRRGGAWAAFVLAFIVLFKLPDVIAKVMTVPMLLDLGFTNADVGYVQQGFGLVMTIVGALFGGAVVAKLGVIHSLWVFGVLQAMSNFGFLVLAIVGKSFVAMTIVIAIENFCGGLVTAGFVAFLMSCCDRRYSATQYALLSSLMAVAGTFVGAPTGYVVEVIGYTAFFGLSVLSAIPGMALLPALVGTLRVPATWAA